MSKNDSSRKTMFVFQGGGALGSYQMGAYQALTEFGYIPQMIVGISIGAINAAIIAGNKPEHRLERLQKFWHTITTSIPVPLIDFYGLGRIHNWIGAQKALLHGQDGFYKPRLVNPSTLTKAKPDKISYYDTAPLKETLKKLVDFEFLNQKHMRLALGAVDIDSGDFIFFDSFEEEITPEHIMASAALPPGFPAVEIKGRYYVDGGVYSNTPLVKGINDFIATQNDKADRLCFIVDLFSAKGKNPENLEEVLERVKDIQYSSYSRGANPFYSVATKLADSINYLSKYLTPEGKADKKVQEILDMAYVHKVDIIHLIYQSANKHVLHSKDYNFSREASFKHNEAGYKQTKELIEKYGHEWLKNSHKGFSLYSQEGVIHR